MNRVIVGLLTLAVACGRQATTPATSSFKLVVPGTAIEMQGGETRQIQLLVIGAEGDQVTFSGQLPAFASLTDSLLTLAPRRSDSGEYQIALTATAGGQSTSANLRVIVSVPNTPPNWMPIQTMMGDAKLGVVSNSPFCGNTTCMICPSDNCLLANPPSIYTILCDAERDAVTVDVDVVERGAAFTKNPTYSASGPVGVAQTPNCLVGAPDCVCLQVVLTSSTNGASYDFAIRVKDSRGSVTSFSYAPDGWVHLTDWTFNVSP